MKTLIDIQYPLKRYSLIILTFIGLSCEEDNTVDYDQNAAIFQKVPDPFVQVTTPVVGFQAGTESYDLAFNVINGTKAVTSVNTYSVFTDAETGAESNEVMLGSFPITDPNRNIIESTVTYDDLKAGLTVNGGSLPASDLDLKVGSGWKLRFEGVAASGEVIPLAGNINVAVLSRYAGIYKVIDSKYYRIGVLTATWTGEERFIGSVDEDTFSYNDYWGNFPWTGNQFNFDIDLTSNVITVPITVDGIFGGNRAISCPANAADFPTLGCANTNVLIINDATGKHRIKLTYGYYTDGSGSREFYEELEKVVD